MAIATPMNTPATEPPCDQKPAFLTACSVVIAVCMGGAVGVMVMVLTIPVTVSKDVTGVGDHVEEDEDVVGVDEVVEDVVDVDEVVEVDVSMTGSTMGTAIDL